MALSLVVLVVGCSGDRDDVAGVTPSAEHDRCELIEPVRLTPEVVRTMSHPTDSYSQGLVFSGGQLFESGGRYGESTLRELDPDTGVELRRVDLPAEVFAEGLAIGSDGRLVQLTWKEGIAYEWDPDRFERVGELGYDGEGWGLTTLDDGTLVMSDGSDTVVTRDPDDFTILDKIDVSRLGGDADRLNELEWDGEWLWASRYQTDEILQIDLECATVVGVVDVSALRRAAEAAFDPSEAGGRSMGVPNGVAHVPGTDTYLLTGKFWPTMYEVRLAAA